MSESMIPNDMMERVVRSVLRRRPCCFDSHDVINGLIAKHGEAYARALERLDCGSVRRFHRRVLGLARKSGLEHRVIEQGRGAKKLNKWVADWIRDHAGVSRLGDQKSFNLWEQCVKNALWRSN